MKLQLSGLAAIKHKILFAGPLCHKNEVGGVVLLFEDLLKAVGPDVIFVDTNPKNYRHPLLMVLAFSWAVFKACVQGVELSLHGTPAHYRYLGTITLLLSYCGLKYHTRMFGGDFDVVYQQMSWRWIVAWFLRRSRVNFFETMYLVRYFSVFNSRTLWFSNYRSSSDYLTPQDFGGNFVFVGHVKQEKGVDRLLALAPLLPPGWKIDIYGQLVDYNPNDFQGNISYCGALDSSRVCETLAKYSALLLLSYREGYPGVIIEAYSVGLPVVVSNLPSLREIVDTNSGVVVEDLESVGFLAAIREVAEQYPEKRKGARKQFIKFEREFVLQNYFAEIGRERVDDR